LNASSDVDRKGRRAGVLLAAAVTAGMALNMPSLVGSTFSLFLKPVSEAFGWGRDAMSTAVLIAFTITTAFYPLVGKMVDRWGARPVVLPGTLILGATIMSLALLRGSPSQFDIQFFAVATAGTLVSGVVYGRALAGVFDGNRGKALGICLCTQSRRQLQLFSGFKNISDDFSSSPGSHKGARQKQIETGMHDQGNRAAVTAGKNMDGSIALAMDLIKANGLASAKVQRAGRLLTLPGFFRPTKLWDLLVLNDGRLVAALEFKSQVGSFGNNFNNRTEEAIGTAHDLWTAYREGAFGPRPFVAWLMLVEDAQGSRTAVRDTSPHFPVFAEFQGASYLKRYDILCQRLVQEQLYTSASVIASPRTAIDSGDYAELSGMTSMKTFVTSFAGHIAAEAARTPPHS